MPIAQTESVPTMIKTGIANCGNIAYRAIAPLPPQIKNFKRTRYFKMMDSLFKADLELRMCGADMERRRNPLGSLSLLEVLNWKSTEKKLSRELSRRKLKLVESSLRFDSDGKPVGMLIAAANGGKRAKPFRVFTVQYPCSAGEQVARELRRAFNSRISRGIVLKLK